MPEARLRITFRGRQADAELSDSTLTLRQLSEAVQREFQVDPANQKLLVGGKLFLPVEALDLHLSEAGMFCCTHPIRPLLVADSSDSCQPAWSRSPQASSSQSDAEQPV